MAMAQFVADLPRRALFVAGVRLTAEDCPGCLRDEKCECCDCEYFEPRRCPLRYDDIVREEVRSLIDLYRAQDAARRRLHDELAEAMVCELREHGRPLHYTVVAQMVSDRYPQLDAQVGSVLGVLNERTDLFEKVDEGVFKNVG